MASSRPSSSDGGSHPSSRGYDHAGQRSHDPSPYRMRPPSPSRRRPDGRYYADRSSLPIPQSYRPPSGHKRMSWPPSPAVEDEVVALAKEVNPDRASVSDTDEAQSRGTIDQYPIILDVPEQVAKLRAAQNQFHPAPPGLEDDVNIRGRQRSLPLDDDFADPALLSRRQPSPYVFTPKAPMAANGELDDSGYFSSRDMKVPVRSAATPGRHLTTPSRTSGQRLHGSSLHIPRDSSDDALDSTTDDDAPKAIPDRKPARYSSVQTDKQRDELRTSLRAMMESKGDHSSDGRSDADDASTRSRGDGDTRRPPPLAPIPSRGERAASLVTPLYTGALSSIASRKASSRPPSPSQSNVSMPLSPPRSPVGSYYSKNNSPQNGWTSRPGSRPTSRGGSRPGSRAGSPSSSDHSRLSHGSERNEESVRRTATFPALPEDRSHRLSRLSAATFPPETDPSLSRGAAPLPLSGMRLNALPYPVDEPNFAMPSEEAHRQTAFKSYTTNRPPSRGQDVPYSSTAQPDSPRRPVSRHTVSEGVSAGALGAATAMTVAKAEAHRTSETAIFAVENIKACPRPTLSAEHSDWYGLEGLSSFNICPSCLEANFADSSFRGRFKRQPRKERDARTKCDFASPWMRIAFVMTKQQRRTDLNLLYAVANVMATERACPGAHREARTWYTVLNERGSGVEHFDVCSHDVKMVEALMPSLHGIFARAYTHTHRRKCDLRAESKRFPRYLDLLLDINDKALRSRRSPEMQGFIDFAGKKAQTRECSRDDIIPDESWHIIPQLPEFTVCEECYTDIIWPAIAEGSSVAAHFNRTPVMVIERTGSSCQLYSPRMRKVFDKSVRRGDYNYLVQHARERKDKEMSLQAQFASVKRLMEGKPLTYSGPPPNWQTRLRTPDDFADEIERISAEWRKWE